MKVLPKVNIAHLPTRIEALKRLTSILRGPEIFIKRDDQTGLAFGGNKTRKLEFLIGEAQSLGAQTLITAGALQSNHCRQTAAAAARFGFNCILVLAGSPTLIPSANYFLDRLFGAEIYFTEREGREAALESAFEKASSEGRQPYLIPYGGSNEIGAVGYVFAIEELMSQGEKFDWIIFPSSSGGTQAGLVAGCKLFGMESKILGISVDERAEILRQGVSNLSTKVSEHLGEPKVFEPGEILVNADYCESGYGMLTRNEIEAIHIFAREEGVLLDPVYTGRAAAGLLDLIRQGFFNSNDKVLFWHTGGTPALFAEQYQTALEIE